MVDAVADDDQIGALLRDRDLLVVDSGLDVDDVPVRVRLAGLGRVLDGFTHSSVLSGSVFRDDDVVSGRAREQVTARGAVHPDRENGLLVTHETAAGAAIAEQVVEVPVVQEVHERVFPGGEIGAVEAEAVDEREGVAERFGGVE